MQRLFIILFVTCLCVPVQADERDFSAIMDQGLQALCEKNYPDAVKLFEQAVEMDKENPEAWMLLGTAYNRAGRYDRTGKALDRARALGTHNAALMLETGRAQLGLGLYEQAFDTFQKDMDKHPWQATSYLYAGICLYHLEQYEDAMDLLKDSVTKDINLKPQAYYYVGLSQAAMNQLSEAEYTFNQVANLPPAIEEEPGAEVVQNQIKQADLAARRIRAQAPKSWYASLSAGAEYNSNVLSLSRDTLLPEDISSTRDSALFMVFQGGFRLHKSAHCELWATGMAYANTYSLLDDMDVQQYKPALSLTLTPSEKWMFRSNLSYTHYRVDEKASSDSRAFYQSASFFWRPDMSTALDYNVSFSEFKQSSASIDDRDGSYNGLRLVQKLRFKPGNSSLDIGARYGWNNTEGEQFDSDAYGFLSGFEHDFFWKTKVRYDVTCNRITYDARSSRAVPAFSRHRKDKSWTSTINLSREFTSSWQTSLVFGYVNNDSNITVYDYDKYTVSTSMTYSF